MEAAPRMLMVISLPGEPDVDRTETPAIWPCKACSIRPTGRSSNDSEPILAIEPTTFAFLTVPYPTTTTSLRTWASSCMTAFNIPEVPTFKRKVLYPIYEISIIPCSGAFCKLKLPFKSVTTPNFVPFTTALAPIIGSPFWSTTRPFTLRVCEKTPNVEHKANAKKPCLSKFSSLNSLVSFISLFLIINYVYRSINR